MKTLIECPDCPVCPSVGLNSEIDGWGGVTVAVAILIAFILGLIIR